MCRGRPKPGLSGVGPTQIRAEVATHPFNALFCQPLFAHTVPHLRSHSTPLTSTPLTSISLPLPFNSTPLTSTPLISTPTPNPCLYLLITSSARTDPRGVVVWDPLSLDIQYPMYSSLKYLCVKVRGHTLSTHSFITRFSSIYSRHILSTYPTHTFNSHY